MNESVLENPTLLKPKELCEIFRVTEKGIYAMLYKGSIPGAFQIDASWFIDRDILLRSLKNMAEASAKKFEMAKKKK